MPADAIGSQDGNDGGQDRGDRMNLLQRFISMEKTRAEKEQDRAGETLRDISRAAEALAAETAGARGTEADIGYVDEEAQAGLVSSVREWTDVVTGCEFYGRQQRTAGAYWDGVNGVINCITIF